MLRSEKKLRVIVWRSVLLPASETFVRAQVDALGSLGASVNLIGIWLINSALSRPSDTVLYGASLWSRLLLRTFTLTGRSRRITRLLRDSTDVVVAHFLQDAMMVAAAAKRARRPLVVVVHGYDITARPRGLRGLKFGHKLRVLEKKTTIFLAVSHFIRDQLILAGVQPEKISVHYTGIPLAKPGSSRTSDNRDIDVLFVGRLTPKKGVNDLLAALALGSPVLKSARVVIAGAGPQRRDLTNFAKAKKLNVQFLGQCTPPQISDLMARSRVFCGPSLTAPSGDAEGLGHVFLEAGLHCVPVVAYAHGGVPEAVLNQFSGLLVEEGNVEELAKALENLLLDPDRAQLLGLNGQAFVTEYFNIVENTRVLLARVEAMVRST